MTIMSSGGGGAAPASSYLYVENGAGQTFIHGNPQEAFTFDAVVYNTSGGYTAVVGADHITVVKPGVYLAIADVYIDDTALTTGEILISIAHNQGNAFGFNSAAPAIITDNGAAGSVSVLILPANTQVQLLSSQSDSINHSLSCDLGLIRLGAL